MKFCDKPFNSIHLDPNGGCRLCAWTDVKIGDLIQEDLEKIWNSENANKIRKAIKQGNYEFCRKTSCPFLENNSLPEISEEDVAKISTEKLPIKYSVACDYTCNHSCPSCRNGMFIPNDEYTKRLSIILEKILPYLNRKETEDILTDGNGDCFASKQIMYLLERLNPENSNCKIGFETNGALFDKEHWNRIKHLAKYNIRVTITPNSFIKPTFEYLNGGHHSFENVMNNLKFIKELKAQGDINRVRISIVVQESNFWELPDFAKRCLEEFGADDVVAKPLYRWFMLSQDDYWFKDILNPAHPYHKKYLQMLEDPIFNDKRIYFWGAHNLHEYRLHPAYIYQEHMKITETLLNNERTSLQIQNKLYEMHVDKVYIYGDMELASIVYHVLKETDIVLGGFLARDIEKKIRCGQEVMCLDKYVPNNEDSMLIVNYNYMEQITRDLHFRGFYGLIISVKELIESISE